MPQIPLIINKEGVDSGNALDRSYSSVSATPAMFGAHEAAGMKALGDGLGTMLTAIGRYGQEGDDKARKERVAIEDAKNPLAPTALQAAQEAPVDGKGLVDNTVNKLAQKIDEDAARLFPDDPKAARDYRINKYTEMQHYTRSAAVMQGKMQSEASVSGVNDALNATDNLVRTDPTGYDLAATKGDELIRNAQFIPQNVKANASKAWQEKLANTRFEGMIANARSAQDLELIEAELTGPSEQGGPNEWQAKLKGQDYEKLVDKIRTGRTGLAHKAATEASSLLTKYEARTDPVPGDEMRMIKTQVDAAQNPVLALRFAQFVNKQDIIARSKGQTPQQLFTKSNILMGGAGQAYPGIPTEVSDHVNEATTLFPGVSGTYLAATAVREYGGNFRTARPKTNDKYAPVPQHKGVDISNVSPVVRDNLSLAGELFGQPITVTSGYRSQGHQDNIRMQFGDPDRAGVAKHSNHTHAGPGTGKAVDISTVGMDAGTKARLVDSLVQAGFTGFGEYETHIHADMRDAVPGSYRNDKASTWGGWTNLSQPVKDVLDKRGYAPGKGAQYIDRNGPVVDLRKRGSVDAPTDYGVKNPNSSATGLYQYIDGTWDEMVGGKTPQSQQLQATIKSATGIDLAAMTPEAQREMRKNPRIATIVAAASATQNKRILEGALKRDVSDAELYMGHFMGTGGATAFLGTYDTDRTKIAATVLPDAAAKNKEVFYTKEGRPRTVEEVYNNITTRFGAAPDMVSYQSAVTYRQRGDALQKGLNTNPIATARSEGMVTVLPLDNTPASWASRGQSVVQIGKYYETALGDVKPLDSDTEVQHVKQQINDGDPKAIVELLRNMAHMDNVAPGSLQAALDQVGQKNSEFGIAGGLMQKGDTDTATQVVYGSKMMKDEATAKDTLKGDAGRNDDVWNTTARNALIGIKPEARDALFKAANAHYVATYSHTTAQFDPKLYQKSINAVLGGKEDGERFANVNGKPTVLPQGVSGAEMDRAVDSLNGEDLVRLAVDPKGKPRNTPPMYANGDVVPATDIATQGRMEFVGADTYQIRMLDNRLLFTSDAGRKATYFMRLDADAVKSINKRVVGSMQPGSFNDSFGMSP